jgi:hypothetical protein
LCVLWRSAWEIVGVSEVTHLGVCRETVWHVESRDRLGKVCVLRHGGPHLHSCCFRGNWTKASDCARIAALCMFVLNCLIYFFLIHRLSCINLELRLELITNLMHNFIYSIITLHLDTQHVSSIAVLISRRTICIFTVFTEQTPRSPLLIGALDGSIQSVTIADTVNIQIVLLKMSTAMLETCWGSRCHVITE